MPNKKVLIWTGEETMGNAEFLSAFKKAMDLILKKEKNLEQAVALMKQTLDSLSQKINNDNSQSREDTKRIVQSELESLLRRFSAESKRIENKLALIENGKDADETKIVEDVLAQIPEPKIPTIDEFLALIPEKIFGAEDIDGLEEYINDRIPRQRTPFGGSVVHKFMDDDTPAGTVNGTNADFRLAKDPMGLKVYVNGQKMTVTEDYTIAGKVITFLTAPPTGSIIRCDYRYF